MDLWAACGERIAPTPLGGNLLRIVESREQVATSALVDDLGEQALLEGMLECIKPLLPAGTEGLHTLLAAPFRYPPLRHGSHFGSRLEPSLFHGSQRLTTLLAEAAYYRFVFWTGMSAPPPSGRLLTQHTVRGARYRTQRGLRLQRRAHPHPADPPLGLRTHPTARSRPAGGRDRGLRIPLRPGWGRRDQRGPVRAQRPPQPQALLHATLAV